MASRPSDPVAALSVQPTGTVDEIVVVDASASYDPGGFIKSAQLNMGDGVTVHFGAKKLRPHPHIYRQAGEYVVTLSVVDNQKHSSSAQAAITINAGAIEEPSPPPPDNIAPVVSIAFDQETGVGMVGATDADAVLSGEVFCDGHLEAAGPVPLTFSVNVTALTPGPHLLEATVVDSALNVGSSSTTFTVPDVIEPPVDPLPPDPTMPKLAWISPAASPYTTTDDTLTLSLTATGAIVEASWVNDAIYINPQSSNIGRGLIVNDSVTNRATLTLRGVRIAPSGVVNTITATVKNAAGAVVHSQIQVIRVTPLESGTFHLPDAVTGVEYGHGGWPLRGIGGKPPYTWAVVGGALPEGFSLSRDGILSGTPTGTGTFPFTVRCTDSQETPATVEQDLELVVADAPAEGPHDYFNRLSARSDVLTSKSLRDAAQVVALRTDAKNPTALAYEYPTDPDLRKQDAMKVRIAEGKMGPGQQLHVPFGPTTGQHVLIVVDFWYGTEWRPTHSQLEDIKGTPLHVVRGGDQLWAGGRIAWRKAILNPATLPSGGPFVGMTFAQAVGKAGITKPPQSWCCETLPKLFMPTNLPASQGRSYPESIMPIDESVIAGGQELGVVGERWHRLWHYFERVADEDWMSTNTSNAGTSMLAYKWTLVMADTRREPMRYVNGAIIGIPQQTNHLVLLRIEHAPGNSAEGTLYVGRGELTAYYRNVVVLGGVSRAEVETLLQKPVN